MDISLNVIDLQYLTNACYMKREARAAKINNTEDIGFYRKRIFQLTKDFLCGKKVTSHLDNTFMNYAKDCIEYFKFIDQSEIIQNDYLDLKKIKNAAVSAKNYSPPNHLLTKRIQPVSKKITDCIPIKYTKKAAPPFMPMNRNINLKDPKFRSKGVLNKNMYNKYGKTDKKKKKKKKKKEKKTSTERKESKNP